ncbi:MAG: hypothetical protein JSV56_04825, partial [Methanomassiliicoccales archaeon]
KLVGTLRNDMLEEDPFFFYPITFVTDSEIINTNRLSGFFSLKGKTKFIPFDISLDEKDSISIDTHYWLVKSTILLKGKARTSNFNGIVWSNRKFYFPTNPRFITKNSGYLTFKIIRTPGDRKLHRGPPEEWEFKIEGQDVDVKGLGFPFWSIGLLLSVKPFQIIIAYNLVKKDFQIWKSLQKYFPF